MKVHKKVAMLSQTFQGEPHTTMLHMYAFSTAYIIASFLIHSNYSSSHNSVVLHPAANSDDPQLPNIHCKAFIIISFACI